MTKRDQTILAFDPGLRDLGFALLSGKRLLASGVLQLRAIPPRRRLGKVREAVHALIRGYEPRALVIEHVPRRPLDALAGLPALGRLLRRTAARRRLTFDAYSPKTIRQSVIGDGWAGKREVAEVLSGRFPELRVHLTQDRKWKERYWQNMFDAVAVALHHQTLIQPP